MKFKNLVLENIPRVAGRIVLVVTLAVWATTNLADSLESDRTPIPIGGVHHPEDLEVMPNEDLIIISEYGSLNGAKSGSLSTLRIEDEHIERVFPMADTASSVQPDLNRTWGDKSCPSPVLDAFDPHGIHHSAHSDARRLLVVNHGGRESIEFFEINMAADTTALTLTWRGCVLAPPDSWFNDVVGLPDGGIVATHMMPRNMTGDAIEAVEDSKVATGYALEWQPGTGWRRLAGTDGALTNGIEISTDGAVLYINYYLGDQVVAVERATGKRIWTADVDGPDNSSWASDGKLLVASHRDKLASVLHCAESTAAFCPVNYAIIAIDAETGKSKNLMSGGGAPFGGATVAVDIERVLYLGSFAGNRMARFPLTPE